MPLCREFTGATGLEPATSGVTGRHGATGSNRLRPGITGYSRGIRDARTGCDRLQPAATWHSLCGMRVVEVVTTSTTGLLRRLRSAKPFEVVEGLARTRGRAP